MSDVIRLKKSTVDDLNEIRKILEDNFKFSIDRSMSDSTLIDLCINGYLRSIKGANIDSWS